MSRGTVQNVRSLAYALEFPMDIMTGVGLVSGIIVVSLMIFMGGDLHMFISEHAMIIIFGGSIAATMIRFPLSAILHGLPLGARSGRRTCPHRRNRAQARAGRPRKSRDRRPVPRQGNSICRRWLRSRIHPRQSRTGSRQLPDAS